jgi:hypothetical protein
VVDKSTWTIESALFLYFLVVVYSLLEGECIFLLSVAVVSILFSIQCKWIVLFVCVIL